MPCTGPEPHFCQAIPPALLYLQPAELASRRSLLQGSLLESQGNLALVGHHSRANYGAGQAYMHVQFSSPSGVTLTPSDVSSEEMSRRRLSSQDSKQWVSLDLRLQQ